MRKKTNTVSNPLKPINPKKDVTVKVGGHSVDGKSVYLDCTFLYQLDSSILPADRAYQKIANWGITDQLDPAYDKATGQWAVYAARDLYRAARPSPRRAKDRRQRLRQLEARRRHVHREHRPLHRPRGHPGHPAYLDLVSATTRTRPAGAPTSSARASPSPTATRISSRSTTTARTSNPTSCGPAPRT